MPVKPHYGLLTEACGDFEAWWDEEELGDFEDMGLFWAPSLVKIHSIINRL
jgi:hypothetical protein